MTDALRHTPTDAVPLVNVWRGSLVECVHAGHAVVCDARGQVHYAWGNPEIVTYARSSAKMIQALPLVESGAADTFGLRTDQLALACASHIGADYHTGRVQSWIADLGLTDEAFRCGAHPPLGRAPRNAMIRAGEDPCQYHNQCSGKHAGFLTLNKHLDADAEYTDIDHPVQRAVLSAVEETAGETSPGWGIDGCSAPIHAATLRGTATAMARFAAATAGGDTRQRAMVRLREAMMAHPELVSGENRPCTDLMRACRGRAALKAGADGFYVAILPDLGLGVALKLMDGAERGRDPAMAAILHKLGLIGAGDPVLEKWMTPVVRNWRGIATGRIEVVL